MNPPRALIGRGPVRHARRRPVARAFRYDTWFLLLPMRTLRQQPDPVLARNRAARVSFHDCDHGDGGDDALPGSSACWRPKASRTLTARSGCTPIRACSATPSSR